MANLRLSGKNIGILRDFDLEIAKLTLLSGESGSGKTTIAKSLCYLSEAGARLDEVVLETLLSFYTDLSEDIEDRVKDSDLTDERKKEISEILWDEGIEPHMDEFLKEGLITQEEFDRHADIISHDYFRYDEGDERFLSDLQADTIEDTIDFEFPYMAECGNDGERFMRLEGFAEDEDEVDVAEVVLREDCEVKSAVVPYVPETIYLSNVPIVESSGYLEDDEEEQFGYRTIEERRYFQVTEPEFEDEEDEEEIDEDAEDFQDKLEAALERFLGDTVRGGFDYDEDEDQFTYYRDEDGEGFDLECMPSSYKAIADLALLIRKKAIRDYSILVIDGLEQTLSPQWKTCLAEFLVGLSRLGHVRVVISSNSSEFIEALTFFADEYLEDEDFRCYMTEYDEEFKSHVIDVTEDFEPLDTFLYGEEAEDEELEDDDYFYSEDDEDEEWEEDDEEDGDDEER